jgi:hypothetical protein
MILNKGGDPFPNYAFSYNAKSILFYFMFGHFVRFAIQAFSGKSIRPMKQKIQDISINY